MKRLFSIVLLCGMLCTMFCGGVSAETNSTDVLAGKSALFLGDSIAAGWRDELGETDLSTGTVIAKYNNNGGWAHRIARDYGMSPTLGAVAGNSFTPLSRRSRIVEQIKSRSTGSYDYVILQGGFNDAMGPNYEDRRANASEAAKVGTLAKGYQLSDFDITTFAGALEECLYYIDTYFPKAKVGYIITYQTPYSEYGGVTADSAKMREYYGVAKQICNKWGVTYLDLYDGAGADGKHYSNDVLDMDNSATASVPGNGDHIHLSTLGYDRISPYIAQWMATLNTMGADMVDGLNYINGEWVYCRDGKIDYSYTGSYGSDDGIFDLEDGVVIVNRWMKDAGGWYYVGADGQRVTNRWMMDSVGWCYLGADGYCITNAWVADSVGWCYLDAEGRMVTNAWVMDSVGWCYLGADGYCITNAWVADSIGWCYLDGDGRMVTNAWVMDSVGWCYLGADGYCITNAWVADSVGWCYLGAEGRMVTNAWVMDSVGWCYLGADGYCVTNAWMADSIGWCYLGADGRMVTNAWVEDSNGLCYIGADGYWIPDVV